jgi:predicted nucleotidyltransferase
MAQIELHPDFRDFLRLLNSHRVEYLVVGGYAVGYHGYPRATGDLDVWIALSEDNAERAAKTLHDFGMSEREVTKDLFTQENKVIRMGVPPVRIEVITTASGVDFEQCYKHREVIDMDGVPVNFISLDDLKVNKRACARHKDLEDLDHLP